MSGPSQALRVIGDAMRGGIAGQAGLTLGNLRARLRMVPDAAPAPVDGPRPAQEARIEARAQLVASYAAVLGRSVPEQDVIAALAPDTDATPAMHDDLMDGLTACGLIARQEAVAALEPALWPALVRMRGEQWLLVLSQTGEGDAAEVTIYDAAQRDHRMVVAMADFAPHFLGEVIQAEVPLDALGQAHSAPRASH